VREGAGQLVLIMGEPGICKTRLMTEFRARIAADQHLWIECAGLPFLANTPFHAVTQMLNQGLDWHGDEDPGELLSRLERALEPTGMKLTEAVPLIAEMLILPASEKYPSPMFPPEQRRKRLLANLAAWVFATTLNQPLVIVMEDLHWVDPSTIELLQTLGEQGAKAPLLLLCTARPEFRASWPMRAHHAQITLNRLTTSETLELVEGVIARAGLAKDVIDAVIERTDGVPLFAEELTRLMLEGDGQAARRDIPETLHDSLAARLDRLGPAKEVAQFGAVLGREFSYELLEAVAQMPQDELESALTKLGDAELIYVHGLPPDARYQFKHALIQDVAYEALLKSRRRELHAHIAHTITEKFPTLAETQPQMLGRHWAEAGDAEKAYTAWLKAATTADARHAFVEAAESFRQAIANLKMLPETPQRDERELELGVAFAMVIHTTLGNAAPEAVAIVARNNALAEKGGDLDQLMGRRFGNFAGAFMAGNWTQASPMADQLLDLAERGDADETTAGNRRRLASYALFLSHYYRGNVARAEDHFATWKSLERFMIGPERYRVVPALSHGATCARHAGSFDLARQRNDAANSHARDSQDPWEIAFAQVFEGLLYIFLQDPCPVEAASARALATARESNLQQIEGLALPGLGWAQAQQGRPREGIGLIRDGIAKLGGIGHRVTIPFFLTLRSEAEALAGMVADAFASYEEALTFNPDEAIYRPHTLISRGELRFGLTQHELAEDDFRDAIALARASGAKGYELRAATGLAHLQQARGDKGGARATLAPIYAWFTQGFDTVDLMEAKRLLDKLA
jgi:hypothetical protein